MKKMSLACVLAAKQKPMAYRLHSSPTTDERYRNAVVMLNCARLAGRAQLVVWSPVNDPIEEDRRREAVAFLKKALDGMALPGEKFEVTVTPLTDASDRVDVVLVSAEAPPA